MSLHATCCSAKPFYTGSAFSAGLNFSLASSPKQSKANPFAMATRAAALNISLVLVLSLALRVQGGTLLKQSNRRPSASASPEEEEYVPVRSVVYRPSSSSVLLATTTTTTATEAVVSSYEPFELCQGCRCCLSSNASSCVDTSCCYAIDCDLPGKPFGTCAFTPHTCGCSSAATGNCTQQPS